MEKTIDSLLGNQCGAVKTERGSGISKRIRKLFKRICRQHHSFQIINHSGSHVHLLLVDYSKEEIENLILEHNGNLNEIKL